MKPLSTTQSNLNQCFDSEKKLITRLNLSIQLLVLIFTVQVSLFSLRCFPQSAINNTGNLPDASAILDVSGSNKGVLINRMTTGQRNAISSPATGLMIFNTTTECFEAFVNGGWYSISCPAPCSPPSPTVAGSATNVCSTSFTARWSSSTGATNYFLDLSSNSSFTSFVNGYNNLNVGNTTSFSVTGLTNNTSYYYRVRAATGCSSANSNIVPVATSSLCMLICSEFQKSFSLGGLFTYYYSILVTPDGGYILGGWTNVFGVGAGPNPTNAYLVKINPDGTVAWSKTYGGSVTDWAISLMITSDGGYALAGTSTSFGTVVYYLIRTDNNGNLLWSRTYDVDSDHYGLRCAAATSDGGFVLGGHGYLLKTKQNGDLDWCKHYTGDFANGAIQDIFAVQQTLDGGYVFTGYGFGNGYNWSNVIKTDASGNITWNIAYDGDEGSIRQTSDGDYILAVKALSGSNNVLVKIDANGSLLWSKQYDGAINATGDILQVTNDGGFVFVSPFYHPSAGWDYYIVKTDGSGNINWTKSFGGSSQDTPTSIQQTFDGGYIVAGISASFGPGSWNLYMLKTDANGNGGSCDNLTATSTVSNVSLVSAHPAMTAVSVIPAVTSPATQVTTPAQSLNVLCTQCN
jgi:hypothetical protein